MKNKVVNLADENSAGNSNIKGIFSEKCVSGKNCVMLFALSYVISQRLLFDFAAIIHEGMRDSENYESF